MKLQTVTIPDLIWSLGDRPVLTPYTVFALAGVLVTLF